MEPVRVEGKNKGHILIYALSTCVWCKKTKRLLDDLGVGYYFIDVDLITGDDKTEVENDLIRWNPRRSFPTIIINNERALIGFDEEEIRGAIDYV